MVSLFVVSINLLSVSNSEVLKKSYNGLLLEVTRYKVTNFIDISSQVKLR